MMTDGCEFDYYHLLEVPTCRFPGKPSTSRLAPGAEHPEAQRAHAPAEEESMLILEVPKERSDWSDSPVFLVTNVETGLCAPFGDLATAFLFLTHISARVRFESLSLFPRGSYSPKTKQFYLVHLNELHV